MKPVCSAIVPYRPMPCHSQHGANPGEAAGGSCSLQAWRPLPSPLLQGMELCVVCEQVHQDSSAYGLCAERGHKFASWSGGPPALERPSIIFMKLAHHHHIGNHSFPVSMLGCMQDSSRPGTAAVQRRGCTTKSSAVVALPLVGQLTIQALLQQAPRAAPSCSHCARVPV